ncbi:MAG: Tex family protein [Oscillospiraceae bacterium]|nr:Tex family protein [Oscillospiraceae bacterium]
MASIPQILAAEFKVPQQRVDNIVALIDEGNTIPFIARYRKELTGSMDDQVLRELSERLAYLRALDARREEVKKSIAEQEKLTDELSAAIDAAATLAEIEDLYRPYKPKRRTRASIAREKGLEPLAAYLLAQDKSADPLAKAAEFIDEEKGVVDAQSALAGARDIIAENLSDSADIRKELRRIIRLRGSVSAKAAKDEDSVYRNYYDYTEPVGRIQSHRVLAVNRGEREGFLKVAVDIPREESVGMIEKAIIRNDSPCKEQLQLAAADGFDRLIAPSVEREIRSALTDAADEQAIKTFGLNLKPLLLQPPVKDKVTLGLDPAYRTGCKIAVVDGTGKVLATAVVYPTPPHNKIDEAREKINALIKKFDVDVISIGNGTASRESEQFVADTIKGTPVKYMIVSEAGASVYSASKLAANEFPDYDVSLRSAVSIARRLQDPLAELVKIDPKSIGVGQYQHDMPPAQLDAALGGVVEDCVNAVGVDLNTASPSLLSYVAGVNAGVSKNIVAYREESGEFKSRKELLKVPKLGKAAFVQCAGFLRIPGAKNPLDNTGVHPESYAAAEQLLSLCGYTLADVSAGALEALPDRLAAHGEAAAAAACGVGVPTLRDIVKELMKPGRDLRDELPPPVLRSDVLSMDDLLPGMELTGTVRNVVDFGAFVDIGVHEDGLVHISRMATRYIKHPSNVVKTGDVVTVWVLDVDKAKKRISLTMLKPETKN